jgi:Na+-driven multidrug efflux pump
MTSVPIEIPRQQKLLTIIMKTAKIAIPSFLCQLFAVSQEILNLWSIGKLNDPLLINAIGLGNLCINFGYASIFGLTGALCTFVSQAVGANDIELCGVYRQRAKIIVTAMLFLFLPLFLNASIIFKALKMDEDSSESA